MKTCVACSRDNKRGGRLCSRCYIKDYYARKPEMYQRHMERVKAYNKANPDKVKVWRARSAITQSDR